MDQLKICPTDAHGLFKTLLRLDASFTMTPRASSRSRLDSNQFLRPKPKKPSCWWFWGPNRQTPLEKCIYYASSTISTSVTVVLDCPITKSSSAFAWLGQPPSWLGQHGLLHLYSCLLMSPSTRHLWSVFRPSWSLRWSLMSVLHRSQSIGMTRLYLTFSISVDHLCALHLHTNTARDMLHIHSHTKRQGCCSSSRWMVQQEFTPWEQSIS
jgi:hypothetical protein